MKRFSKLRLHRKTPEGFNIWNYTVVGERRTRELKCTLVDDAEKALGPRRHAASVKRQELIGQGLGRWVIDLLLDRFEGIEKIIARREGDDPMAGGS